MSWTEHTLASLASEGFRQAGARRAVIELLGHQDCCLSAQEIFDALRARKRTVGIATVYRVLELLTERGLVQRIELGSGTARYEAVRCDAHHHHFVCEDCGKVEAFADSGLERALERVQGSSRYEVVGHDVVLRGACRDCSTA
jgi:Fur family ferric uptake transcriptional regulator